MSGREYPARPLVGIGIVVLRPGAVLLGRRAHAPAEGLWSLPGGGQRLGETAEQAARRELGEETGLTVGRLRLAGHADSIHTDAAGAIRFHYTILDFAALWRGEPPRAGADLADLAWADFDRLADFALWSEAVRVIGQARELLGL
ncbi:MAG: NUDIX hydrolase [Acetobacteraceae bacterium]